MTFSVVLIKSGGSLTWYVPLWSLTATIFSDDYQEEAHRERIHDPPIVTTKGRPRTARITNYLEGRPRGGGGRRPARLQANMSTDGGRKCTICRQSGHNRQTCPVAADTGHWLTRSGIRLLLTFLTCLGNVLMISMWCSRPMNEVVVVNCKIDQSLRKLIRRRDRSPEWFRKCEQGFWIRKLFKGGFFSHGGFLNRIIPDLETDNRP